MRRIAILVGCASVAAWIPSSAPASAPPTRVRLDDFGASPQVWPIEYGGPGPVSLLPSAYGPPSSSATAEIISRAGEIIGTIDNPEKRNQLAQQWLQYSKQVIAKDQEFREQWLKLQRQQLAQQDQAMQLQREMAQLQLKTEELHAQNLRLEQENLQLRQQLAQAGAAPGPRTSVPASSSQ
jgi:hypothetical protein